MTTLTARLAGRRACHTPNCEREAIRDGAYCSDCTNVVWSTGRPPEIRTPEWLRYQREHGLAKDLGAS